MKKFFFLPLTVIGLLLLQGCTKSNNDADNNNQDPDTQPTFDNCRIIKTTRHNFDDHVFEYDDQKRVVRYKFSDYESTFNYTGNIITIVMTSNGNPFYTKTVTLNEAGFAKNVKTEYPNNTWNNDAYEYNGKQLVKMTHTRSSSISVNYTGFQWLDGNMIAETKPNGGITSYTFDLNEVSQKGDYYHSKYLESGFVTVLNKNRIRSVTIPSGIVFNISHNEDAEGKIKSYHVTSTDGADYTKNLIYECD